MIVRIIYSASIALACSSASLAGSLIVCPCVVPQSNKIQILSDRAMRKLLILCQPPIDIKEDIGFPLSPSIENRNIPHIQIVAIFADVVPF